MTLESTISDLYNQGIVCGSTFLYCVENNINSVEALFAVCEDDIPADVVSDISYLKSELKIEIANEQNELIGYSDESEVLTNYDSLYSIYQELKWNYDTRTINRLNYIESSIDGKEEFITFILNVKYSDLLKIQNAGRKTVLQILDLSQRLSEYLNRCIDDDIAKQNEEVTSIVTVLHNNMEDINALLPVIRSYADNYSVRARNGILQLISSCNDNVYQLYEVLSSTKFNPKNLRNIGTNSVPEILDFKNRVINLCTECTFEDAKDKIERISKFQKYTVLGFSNPETIINIENEVGHFPLLAAVNQYINGIPAREYRIIKEYLFIFRGGIDRNLDDIANELALTRERIRQLANKQINILEGIINSWKGLLADYHYPIFEKDAWLTICEREGVAFTQNFVKWVISLVDDTVHLIGDPISAFKTSHGRITPLYIMPKHLYDIFDIHSFIGHINNIAAEKRYKEEHYNLKELIFNFFRDRVLFESVDELEVFARRIIDIEVDCLLYEGDLIFRANAVKTMPEIIEDIIRANGDVMSLDEIYDKYKELYPLKDIEPKNIRSNIHQNQKIRPLGRSGRYTLSEWNDGYSRGGTIREFAYECIVNNPEKIVRVDVLCKYISQYREGVEEDSIQTNLLAESSGKFGLYFREGERYIGLTSMQYKDCYIVAANDESMERRSTKQSYTLLENFIVEHKRFPFSSGPDDEPRLYRFWYNQTNYYNHGDMDVENRQIYDYINAKYGGYKVSQSDYIWYKRYIELSVIVDQQRIGDIKKCHNKWLLHNVDLYKSHQLAEWQVPLFKKLLNMIIFD